MYLIPLPEPELNPAYAELAQHYGIAVLPARVRKPRDKAKVETGVQIVERNILAPLRNRTFFSLREANEAIWQLLEDLNSKPFQQLPGSRKSVFDELEKPVLKPLPVQPYVLANWKKAKVNIDYHIQVDGHYYLGFLRVILWGKVCSFQILELRFQGFWERALRHDPDLR